MKTDTELAMDHALIRTADIIATMLAGFSLDDAEEIFGRSNENPPRAGQGLRRNAPGDGAYARRMAGIPALQEVTNVHEDGLSFGTRGWTGHDPGCGKRYLIL
jgi:hypothetical protein